MHFTLFQNFLIFLLIYVGEKTTSFFFVILEVKEKKINQRVMAQLLSLSVRIKTGQQKLKMTWVNLRVCNKRWKWFVQQKRTN